MATLMSDAELAILSILAEHPMSGVKVEETITLRQMRLWTLIGVESVFYLLERLEAQGLILNVDQVQPEDKRHRMYRLTSAGMGVLQTAINDLLSQVRSNPTRFEIGLINSQTLKPSQVHHALLNYQAQLRGRLKTLRDQLLNLQGQDAPFLLQSMFEHHLVLLEAETAWFDDWLKRWEAQAPPDPITNHLSEPAIAPRMHQVIVPSAPESVHKAATQVHHHLSDDDFPPPPQHRVDPNATRLSQPTPPIQKKPRPKP